MFSFCANVKSTTFFQKFLRFKLNRKDTRKSGLYKPLQAKLLLLEISSKESACCARRGDATKADGALHTGISSWLDLRLVKSFISRTTREFYYKSSIRHRKKLRSLGLSNDLTPCYPGKIVHNYCSLCISNRTKTFLAYGLEFSLPVYKLDFYRYFLPFDYLVSRLNNDNHVLNKSELFPRLDTLFKKHYYGFKPYKAFSSVFRKDDIQAAY